MAVSEAFLKAGVRRSRERALQLILAHVPTLLTTNDPDKLLAARRGLQFAGMLGRQHGFEHEVDAAIARLRGYIAPHADPELAAALEMFKPAPEPIREAAE